MSSVQLLDEAAAERQRVDLINRLVKEALTADFDGGWWAACLTSTSAPAALHHPARCPARQGV